MKNTFNRRVVGRKFSLKNTFFWLFSGFFFGASGFTYKIFEISERRETVLAPIKMENFARVGDYTFSVLRSIKIDLRF